MSVDKRALLIGINYYGTNSQLNGCINDVNNIKDYLVNKWGYQLSNIRVLTDLEQNRNTNNFPTKVNILNAMRKLVENATSNTRIVFHYSGHGSQTYDNNRDESDGRDETLVPVDYNKSGMITDDIVRITLVDPLPVGSQLFCLNDACHSGTLLDIPYNVICEYFDDTNKYSISHNKKYKNTKANVMAISGCQDNQTSADYLASNRQFCGAMSRALLDVLSYYETKNTKPTYIKLIKHLRKQLKERQFTQIPQLTLGNLVDLTKTFSLI